jgi:uncharacterized membrane protein YfhO
VKGLKEVLPVNLGMPYKLEFPGGYDAIYPISTAKFIAALNSENSEVGPQNRYGIIHNIDTPLIDLVNMKYLLLKLYDPYNKERYEVVFKDRNIKVVENKKVQDRSFMVYDWDVVNDLDEQLRILVSRDFPIGKKVLVSEEINFNEKVKAKSPYSKVEYLSYKELSSQIKVETESDGLLFISDTYYPGWKVFVDGNEQELLRANYTFRTVKIPKGKHLVEMVYKPESFRIGLIITLLSFVILITPIVYSSFLVKK